MLKQENSHENSTSQNNKLLLLIIAIASLLIFLNSKNVTAFEWPAIDMAVFFERYYDRSFLLNDFFTNVSFVSNPRFVFGYFIILLAKFFDNSWYNTFFFLKTFFILSIPSLFYLVCVSFFDKTIKDKKQNFFFKLIIAVCVIHVLFNSARYAVAWWPPIYFFVAPQTLSLFFALLAMVIFNYSENKVTEKFALLLFFFATLLHFSVGLCVFIFGSLFWLIADNFSKNSINKTLIRFVWSVLLPASIIYFVFKPEISLSAQEFIKYYVIERHPKHYLPSKFGSFDGKSWYISFARVIFLMVLALTLAGFKRNKIAIKATILCLFSYFGCVIAQYFLVEIYQVKFFAILGLSRFLFLGYWMASICLALSLIEYCNKLDLSQIWKYLDKILIPTNHLKISYLLLIGLLANILVYKFYLDDPYKTLNQETGGLFSWIKNNTKENEVILSTNYNSQIPIIAKRATLVSGFPFREDFFSENSKRSFVVYNLEHMNEEQIRLIAKDYQARYLVVRSDQNNIIKQIPVFDNQKFLIYKLN